MTKQYGMVIDTTRCMGCHTCVISCKVSNDTPAGIYWSRVLSADRDRADKVRGTFPNATIGYSPELCNHCATPACVENCPTGAMHKDERGLVSVDAARCIGCGICQKLCPAGAITVQDNLSHIDESLCLSCGQCAVKCPRHAIYDLRGILTEKR